MYNLYQNGNMYQTPYNASYGGFMPSQGNYTGQAPFAPQNGNYAPQTATQQQSAQMNTNKIYVTGIEDASAGSSGRNRSKNDKKEHCYNRKGG